MTIQLTDIQIGELTENKGEIYQLGSEYTWSMKISVFLSYNTTLVFNYGSVFPDFQYIVHPEEIMTISGTLVEPNLSLPEISENYPSVQGTLETEEEAKLSIISRVAEVVKKNFVWYMVVQTPYNIQMDLFFSSAEDYDNVAAMIKKLSQSLAGGTFI